VPLIILDPRKPGKRINPALGAQIDVLPTVLDLMRIPVPPGELYEGVSLYSEDAAKPRPIFIDSPQQRAVIRGNLYSLEDIPPGQSKPVSSKTFEIVTNGVHTTFREIDRKDQITEEMSRFERFQKNLILHYDYWKRRYAEQPTSAPAPAP
jgi:hypothetical protein